MNGWEESQEKGYLIVLMVFPQTGSKLTFPPPYPYKNIDPISYFIA